MKGQGSPDREKRVKISSANVKSSRSKKVLLPIILGVIAAIGGSIFAFMSTQNPEFKSIDEKQDVVEQPGLSIWAQIALANQNVQNNCPACSVAIVKPVFTHSAYQEGAFYTFYERHTNEPSTLEDLHMLTTEVLHGWGHSRGALIHFYPLIKDSIVNVITDIDVHENDIAQYNKLILLHSEYVTQEYYDNLRSFVANGGTLILFDADSLYAEVLYDDVANTITLKKGHWWAFDGSIAESSVGERWEQENQEFIGSNYAIIGKNGEENVLKNPNAICLHEWNTLDTGKVCTYRLNYGKGVIYHAGIFGSWNIHKEPKLQELVQGFL
ncbi:MAG: N,N-dimethylformamidase beta subunit family domain-containing protein [Nitrososphaerales archaeon]